ncbi:uncharacterized protein [Ptychodera flava]|uniref:uncharacterized protein n=1 Tax=Ptychodera flava TaxID=63121 RepID=UPI00396A9432
MLSTHEPAQNDPDHNNPPKPVIVTTYNKYMCGVDISDMMLFAYNDERKSMKYWKKMVFNILHRMMLNAYIIYKQNTTDQHIFTREEFYKEVIEALVVEHIATRNGDDEEHNNDNNNNNNMGQLRRLSGHRERDCCRSAPCLADEDCLLNERCYWQQSKRLPVGICEDKPMGRSRHIRQAEIANYDTNEYDYADTGPQGENFYDIPGEHGRNGIYDAQYPQYSEPNFHTVHKEIQVGGDEEKAPTKNLQKTTISEDNTHDRLKMKDFGHVFVVHDDDDYDMPGAVIGRDGTVYGVANDYDEYRYAKAPPIHSDDIVREDVHYENVDGVMEIDDVYHQMLPWETKQKNGPSGIENDVDFIDNVAHDPAELQAAAKAAADEAEAKYRNRGGQDDGLFSPESAANDKSMDEADDYSAYNPLSDREKNLQRSANRDPYDVILVYDEEKMPDYDYYGNDLRNYQSNPQPMVQKSVDRTNSKNAVFRDDFMK